MIVMIVLIVLWCLRRKGRENLIFAGGGAGGATRWDAVRYSVRNSTYTLGMI